MRVREIPASAATLLFTALEWGHLSWQWRRTIPFLLKLNAPVYSPPLLPFFFLVFKEHLRFRCLKATWTTARTQITPGWRTPSSTSTWTEEARWSRISTTRWGYINSFYFQTEFRWEFSLRVFDLLLFNTTGGEWVQRPPVAWAKRQKQTHDGTSRLSETGGRAAQQEVLMSPLLEFILFSWPFCWFCYTKKKEKEKNTKHC